MEPTLTSSSSFILSARNLRIVIVALFGDTGGMMMLTREPSGRRASTIGDDSSTRRPMRETIRSAMRMMWALSRKRAWLRSRRPSRSK